MEDRVNRKNAPSNTLPDEDAKDGSPGLEWDLPLAAQSGAPVLLTGKKDAVEALAYRIHILSEWRYGPFIVVDCGWPEERVEAVTYLNSRHGQGGTVLLQEVGRLSGWFQSVLADRLASIHQTGRGERFARRLIASTSEPLLPRVNDGTFDDRLYYRLNVVHIVLRE
jgi:two-component system nitrogen regulation response regulator NtrX